MNHDVGAQRERPLQRRRAEAVVHDQQTSVAPRDVGKRPHVGDLSQRIGGRLQKQQARLRADRPLPRLQVAQFDEVGGNPELAQVIVEQQRGAAEKAVRRDDVVARLEQRDAHRVDRRHAGGGGDAGRAAFQRRQPPFERAHRGIGEARIDVARLCAGKPRRRFGGRAEHVARRREDRFAVFLFRAAHLSGAHRARREAIMSVVDEISHTTAPTPGAAHKKKSCSRPNTEAGAVALAVFKTRPRVRSSNPIRLVMPAKAGIHALRRLDPGLRRMTFEILMHRLS